MDRSSFKQAYDIFNRFLGEQHLDTRMAKEWLDRCTEMQKEGTKVT